MHRFSSRLDKSLKILKHIRSITNKCINLILINYQIYINSYRKISYHIKIEEFLLLKLMSIYTDIKK